MTVETKDIQIFAGNEMVVIFKWSDSSLAVHIVASRHRPSKMHAK